MDVFEGIMALLDGIASLSYLIEHWKMLLGITLLLGGLVAAISLSQPLYIFVTIAGLALLGWELSDRISPSKA